MMAAGLRAGLLAALTVCAAAGAAPATEQAVREAVVREAVFQFAGQRIDSYQPDAELADAVLELMGGPPDGFDSGEPLPIVSGCRRHSCMEKSAAILDPALNELLAVGLRHFRCRKPPADAGKDSPRVVCDTDPTYTLIVLQRRAGFAAEEAALQRLRKWAGSHGPGADDLRFVEARRPGEARP